MQLLVVDLEPDEPRTGRGTFIIIEQRIVIVVEQGLVSFDNRPLGIWIVEYRRASDHLTKVSVLDGVTDLRGHANVFTILLLEQDTERGCLDGGGDVDDFLQAGNTLSHVLGGDTSHVEGV